MFLLWLLPNCYFWSVASIGFINIISGSPYGFGLAQGAHLVAQASISILG